MQEIQRQQFTEEELQLTFEKLFQFSNLQDTEQTIKEIEQLNPILKPVEDIKEFNIMRTLIYVTGVPIDNGKRIQYYENTNSFV